MPSKRTRPVFRWLASCAAGFALACSDRPADETRAIPADAALAQLGQVLAESDPLRRAAGIGALLPRVAPEALPAVREAFERSSPEGLDPETVLLACWWARFDPQGALDWAVADLGASSAAAVFAVFRTWAHEEPGAAWAHTRTLKPQTAELARAGVMAGWEESDRARALAHVRSMASLADRQRAADLLARRRVRSLGSAGAIAWLESLPEGPFRSELEVRVASEVALVDPAAALAWVEPRIVGAKRPTGLPRRVATRWVRSDPVAAMAWLASLPAGADRDDGVMETFRDWRTRDRLAATAWIATRELEPWLEPAFALYAEQIATEQPEEALVLVARFGDEVLRERFTTTIARKWLRRDFAAADAWVKQAAIPEEIRKRIYMLGGKRGGADPAREVAPVPGA